MTASEQTRAAFLRDLLANPKDDFPRLVFADWLEEHGEPDRAEFIRVQIALANCGPHEPDTVTCDRCGLETPLRRRERDLLNENGGVVHPGRDWFALASVTDGTNRSFRYKFKRGFVSSITCEASDWLTHADALTASQPIETVALTTWPTHRELERTAWPSGSFARYHDLVKAVLDGKWPAVTFSLPPPSYGTLSMNGQVIGELAEPLRVSRRARFDRQR